MGSDSGASLTDSTFGINATAFQIVTNGSPIDILDQAFFLNSNSGSYNSISGTGSFSGIFSAGSLLSGDYFVTVLSNGPGAGHSFFGDITNTSGSLVLNNGRIEGQIGLLYPSSVTAVLGTVVPAPAAVWLLDSGLA